MSTIRPFKVIAAIDEGLGIGLKRYLPWLFPQDIKHFASTTTTTVDPCEKNAVIMGRATYETLPRCFLPLPGRHNAVITRNPDWDTKGADIFADLKSAIIGVQDTVETVYVIGGGQIYNLALSMEACEELILTRIHKSYDCDTFFPGFEDRYQLAEVLGKGSHVGVEYEFERWRRNTSQ